METEKENEKETETTNIKLKRKIRKKNNTCYITIPKAITEGFNLPYGTEINIILQIPINPESKKE
jgi:hypothetical protein